MAVDLLVDAGIDLGKYLRHRASIRIEFHNEALQQIKESLLQHSLEFSDVLIEDICDFVYRNRNN